MTTKELIRAEIERRIEWLNTATNDFAEGRRAEIRSLYDFLDTLPDEPVSNDLTKAAEHYAWMKEQPLSNDERLSIYFNPRIEAFKAGAEWMKKQMPMPEDTVLFQKGVEEGKRLMMEGAAKAHVFKSYIPLTEKGKPTLRGIELIYEDANQPYVSATDDVRIIILPEEGEQ